MLSDVANWILVNVLINPRVFTSLLALIILIVARFLVFEKPTKQIPFKRLLGTVLFVFATFVFLYVNIDDLADVFTVWATLILAGVAVFSFEESRRLREENKQREERDRKERLLNEIIEWAEDVAKSAISRRTLSREELWKAKLSYKFHKAKSKYIEGVVGSSFKDFYDLVEGIDTKLDRLIEVTTKFTRESMVDGKKLSDYEAELTESVEKLLIETAKTKTTGIS